MIDLRSLRYLVILARRLSYARTAEDLGISQPALTRTVQNVERQFGVRLFDRDRTGVRLTTEGRAMLDAAAVLVANAEDLEKHWERTAKGQEGVVRFGMAPLPARALLASTLLERQRMAAGVRNEVVVRSVDALWPLLVSGEIEFFVAAERQIPDTPPVRTETLGSFPLSFIVRPGHPLLLTHDSERRFPVLVSSRIALLLQTDLQKHAEGLPHVIEDFGTLARLTAETDAIWASSIYAVADELRSGTLCELPRAKDAPLQEARMMLYSLERRTRSTFAKALIQVLRQEIRALADGPQPSGRACDFR
jgi:DNA-binding transcriptional LysR family regulator